MYDKALRKIDSKSKALGRLKECPSESSFLSEKFCMKVLGKPCFRVEEEGASNFAAKDINKSKTNKNFKIPKEFAVYHLMEKLDNPQLKNSKQSIAPRPSEETTKAPSLDRTQVNKRSSVTSKNSEVKEDDLITTNSKGSKTDQQLDLNTSQMRYFSATENLSQSQDANKAEDVVFKNSRDSVSDKYKLTPKNSSEEKNNEYSKVIRKTSMKDKLKLSRDASTTHEPERYPISKNQSCASDCRYYKNNNRSESETTQTNIREIPKRDVAQKFYDSNSQTSCPSILKQQRCSDVSCMDRYPVKECSWRRQKPVFICMDKTQQTSKNNFDSNTTSAVVNTSINTINSETASVQITELSSTKVQTTNDSTPEEVCYRPIQNFCKCKNSPGYSSRQRYNKKDQQAISQSDRFISKESSETVPPSKPSIMNHVFRPPPSKSVQKPFTLPTDMKRGLQNHSPKINPKHGNPSARRIDMPIYTETSDEVAYYQDSEDDMYDTYDDYQSDYQTDNGDVGRHQAHRRNNNNSPQYNFPREEPFNVPLEECRCCQQRKNIPGTLPRRAPFRPPIPPIDYDFSSSEEDLDLEFDNDVSDYPFFDQSESRALQYEGLPYQNNDQFIDLVQELEETLQSRNKNRVQRALNEFEHKSRLNQPLDRPIIDYEEPSDSEEPIIRRISELNEKRKNNHKMFPCKGKACCTCILRSEPVDNYIPPPPKPKSFLGKKKTQWRLNKTGEWHKVSSDKSNSGSCKRDDCGCTCRCSRQVK